MTTLFDLNGKIALITGASTGIGQAIAEALATAGASVAVAARRTEKLQETVERIRQTNGVASAYTANLEDRESLPNLIGEIERSLGIPNTIVNCAGVNLRQPVDDISIESWDQTLNINLAVPFFLSRLLIGDMKKQGWGKIINIASLQSRRAFPDSMPYGASKGGVEQLTRAMSEAWSKYGINCNAIAPGFFPTELTAPVFDNPDRKQWAANQTTMGRNGKLEDLHGTAVFLASNASNYITGQTLFVDGGFTAR